MAKPVKRVANVTSRRSTMVSGGGGLATGFHATIEEMRAVVWSQPKGKDGGTYDPATYIRAKYRLDEDDQPEDATLPPQTVLDENDGCIVQYQKAAKVAHFVPSLDNEDPVDVDAVDEEDTAGYFLIPTELLWDAFERKGGDMSVGPQLINNTVWADYVEYAEKSSVSDEILDSNDYRAWEGLHVRLDRVKQSDRPGLVREPGQNAPMVLAITEVLDQPKAAKKGASAAKGKPVSAASGKPGSKAAAANANGSDVEGLVTKALVAHLTKKGESWTDNEDTEYEHTLTRKALMQIAIGAVGPKQKKEAMDLLNNKEYLAASENLIWHEEDDMVSLVE